MCHVTHMKDSSYGSCHTCEWDTSLIRVHCGNTAVWGMGWLRLVGFLKLWVSFVKEPYKTDDILQKRPIISRSLLIVATPYVYAYTLQHTATHCNTIQYTVTHCNMLQHAATHCNALQHTPTQYITQMLLYQLQPKLSLQLNATHCNTLESTATHYTTQVLWYELQPKLSLQDTATHCNTPQCTAPYCTILHHTAPYCNILHHTATHSNTLQHNATTQRATIQRTSTCCNMPVLFHHLRPKI